MKLNRDKPDRLIIAFDLDGTLSTGIWWGEGPEPDSIPERVNKVNKMFLAGHVIIIHTARREWMRHKTVCWLKSHGVMYHCLEMEKLGADLYVDDKAVSDVDYFNR